MGNITRFGVSIPTDLVKSFDETIHNKGYTNRSEAIRDMMRDYLVETEWENLSSTVMGTVTIVYNHHTRELSGVLSDIQHQDHDSIICTTHVHLDEHNCLEVIVVKGTSVDVHEIADRLISTKGVKHGKLVCTTTGDKL
ncbi:MAG: nickel-responsive transcriptional regulator NikR [Armatimonadota bacterium]